MMLIEIHVLQNHAPSNLNRDDVGSPKDCIFGGTRRARISSQCIKRSIRRSAIFEDGMRDLGMGIRTRLLPRLVKDALLNMGMPAEAAENVASIVTLIGTNVDKAKKGKAAKNDLLNGRDDGMTAQIMFFSKLEIDSVIGTFIGAYGECKTVEDVAAVNAREVLAKINERQKTPITPDIAMFGRMITSDAFQDVEASMQVAHAISTNEMEQEFDYFTAVDDKKNKTGDDAGAGMIGNVEFTSACYYKYVSFDVDAFAKQMDLDAETAKKVVQKVIESFLRALIFTTPTGKQNTFAAHQLPDAILVEIRQKKIPVSYANAFLKPSMPTSSAGDDGSHDIVDDSIEKLASHVAIMTRKFGLEATGRFWFTTRGTAIDGTTAVDTIDDLISAVVQAVSSR